MSSFRDAPHHAWDIYAQQLFHHGYGLPLWLPHPDPTASEVQIGDVGWMKEGGFLQLFNAMKSEDAQPVRYGVPDDYIPFNPPDLVVSGPHERILQPFLCSRTVREVNVSGGASAGVPAPIPVASEGGSFSFRCAGAFLMFSPKGYSRAIESKRHIVNYMREHHQDWMGLADKYGLDLKEEDLFFVSGRTKTGRWAVAAFQGQYKKKQGTVSADFSSAVDLKLSVSISNQSLPQSWYGTGPRRLHCSSPSSLVRASECPAESGTQEPLDQCIFMRYYKMKRRIWGKIPMQAAAGPHELPSPDAEDGGLDPIAAEDDSESDEDEFGRRKYFDPVNDLLDYILQNSEAAVAIASDRDLWALFQDQEFPHDVTAALQVLQPSIELDEHGVGIVSAAIELVRKTGANGSDPVELPTETLEDACVHGPEGIHSPPRANSPIQARDAYSPSKLLNVPGISYSGDSKYDTSGSENANTNLWDMPVLHSPSLETSSTLRIAPKTSAVSCGTEARWAWQGTRKRRLPLDALQNSDELDDDRSDSDTAEDIVELPTGEIPSYFQERCGRLFHSHSSCPYPLPVDAEEQQRQNGVHQLLRRLIGALLVGPVHDVLGTLPGQQRRVLDLGTGTGSWVLDMAREFPDVRFYGVDIVPIATRYPPHNVLFEMHDIKERFRYNTGEIDMVHARSITMAIRDYGALIPEIARVLRRGGLFVSCEWGRRPAMADGSDVAARAPNAVAFFQAVCDTLLERRGIQTIAPRIPQLLADSGQFTNIVARTYYMPIGDWHPDPAMQELGREYREMVELYARSMRAVLLDGRWAAHADNLVQGYIDEIRHVRGLVSICYTVYATRA